MRVWLDDIRPIREGFDVWVKTAPEAIELLKSGKVTYISLDHDLGDDPSVGSGYDVARFIEEQAFNNSIPRLNWNVHSANPVGIKNMEAALQQANSFWTGHEQQSSTKMEELLLESLLKELKTAHNLFLRSGSPLDRDYLISTWKKLDIHLLALTDEPK